MTSSSSSSSRPAFNFIDLTDDEPDKSSAYLRELETLRAQKRKLEHENSKLKLKLRETQDELKFTRESLGQAVVAMQRKTSATESSPTTTLKRARSPSLESQAVNALCPSRSKSKVKVEECKVEVDEGNPCKVDEETSIKDDMGSRSKTEDRETASYERSKRRRLDHSDTEKRDTTEGIPTPGASSTLSATKKSKKARGSAVPREKKEKSDQSKDFFADLYDSTKPYLKSAKTLKIQPPPLDTRIKRVPFSKHYGGSAYHFLQYIPRHNNPSGPTKRKIVFPQPEMNPSVPSSPGEPGLVFASRHEILENPPWTLFVKRVPSVAVWTYMGEYESLICGRLEAEQFCALSDKVKNRWGEFLLEQQLDVYLSMRVRIALRKAGVIPTEDKNKEEQFIDEEKRAVKAGNGEGNYTVDADDVIKAFSEGNEWIDIIRLTCTSYDYVFARDIQRTFNEPTTALRGPAPQRSRASETRQSSTLVSKLTHKGKGSRSNSENHLGDVDDKVEFLLPTDGENSGDDFIGSPGMSTESHLRRSGRKRPATRKEPVEFDEDEDDDNMYEL